MTAMFDHVNFAKLRAKLSDEANAELTKHFTIT